MLARILILGLAAASVGVVVASPTCSAKTKCTAWTAPGLRYGLNNPGTCADGNNGDCDACYLYCAGGAGSGACDASIHGVSGSTCYFQGNFNVQKTGGDAHWLVLPRAAVRGVDQWEASKGGPGEGFWDAAWSLALQGGPGGANPAPFNGHAVGLAINSVPERSQNQAHMHVANLKQSVRDALNAKDISSSKFTEIKSETGTFDPCSKANVPASWAYARWFPNVNAGPSAVQPFKAAQDFCSTVMKVKPEDCSIVVAGSRDASEGKGFYVVAALAKCAEHFLAT